MAASQLTVYVRNRLASPARCVLVFEGCRAQRPADAAVRCEVVRFNDGHTMAFPLVRGLASDAHELRGVETTVLSRRYECAVADERLVAVYVIVGYHDVCYEFRDRPVRGRVAIFLEQPEAPKQDASAPAPTLQQIRDGMYQFRLNIAHRAAAEPTGIVLSSTPHADAPLGTLVVPAQEGGAESSSRTG